MATEFKIVLVGEPGAGKTAYMKRQLTGEFEKRYLPTVGAEVHTLTYATNRGRPITFKVWDCAGQDKFGGNRDEYCAHAAGALVMLASNDPVQCQKQAQEWACMVRDACGPVRQFFVENQGRRHLADSIMVNVKTNLHMDEPFLRLARHLRADDGLEFVKAPSGQARRGQGGLSVRRAFGWPWFSTEEPTAEPTAEPTVEPTAEPTNLPMIPREPCRQEDDASITLSKARSSLCDL